MAKASRSVEGPGAFTQIAARRGAPVTGPPLLLYPKIERDRITYDIRKIRMILFRCRRCAIDSSCQTWDHLLRPGILPGPAKALCLKVAEFSRPVADLVRKAARHTLAKDGKNHA